MKRLSKTCIAIIKLRSGHVMMAGDRRVSCEDGSVFQCPNPKISKKQNGILIGASGDSFLCKFLVDIFCPPELIDGDIDYYMFNLFLPALDRVLKKMPGFKDAHNLLRLPKQSYCLALVVVDGKSYTLLLQNDSKSGDEDNSSIQIDDIPTPFAIGCGANSAIPKLEETKTSTGCNTKEQLTQAMLLAAQLNSGCDDSIDYIKED